MKLGNKTSDFSPRFRHPTSDILHLIVADLTEYNKKLQQLIDELLKQISVGNKCSFIVWTSNIVSLP